MFSVFNMWLFSEVPNISSFDEFSERLQIVLFTLGNLELNAVYDAYPGGKSWDEVPDHTGSGKKFHRNVISGVDFTADVRQVPRELEVLPREWESLNAEAEPVRKNRDGHCHEGVMWYVHHLPESLKEVITDKASLPLLSQIRHDLSLVKLHTVRVQRAYEEKALGAVLTVSFLMTLLNNTPAEDSHYGNIAECAVGTSGQTSEWYISEVGSQLFTNSDIGSCHFCTVRLRHPVGNKDLSP